MTVSTNPQVTGVSNPSSPGAIGGTTPAAGAFTTLKSQGGNVGYILSQTGLPMVMPSSGSIGNNGALTALTAMTQYTACYMYFPVDKIAVGVAAGFYYVTMSSTTAGTIFNNVYTSGTPAIPASPTAFATTGPGAYTQSTGSFITAISVSIPAAAIGINGEFAAELFGTYNNSAGTKGFAVSFGGTQTSLSPTTTTACTITYRCRNAGVAAVQTSSFVTTTTATTSVRSASTVDTTAAVTFLLRMALGTATDFQVIDGYSMRIFPN